MKTSYQYLKEKIARLEAMLEYQCKQHLAEEEKLKKQLRESIDEICRLTGIIEAGQAQKPKEYPKPEPDKKHGCETCKHQNINEYDLPCVECCHVDLLGNASNKWEAKPELVYIPFTFADADKIIAESIKTKNGQYFTTIYGVYSVGVKTGFSWVEFKDLLEQYTFLDGSPCGKHAE